MEVIKWIGMILSIVLLSVGFMTLISNKQDRDNVVEAGIFKMRASQSLMIIILGFLGFFLSSYQPLLLSYSNIFFKILEGKTKEIEDKNKEIEDKNKTIEELRKSLAEEKKLSESYNPSIRERTGAVPQVKCTQKGGKGKQTWTLVTTWKRYKRGNEDDNIFHQGVEEFARRVEQASEGCLVVNVKTLDEYTSTSGHKVPYDKILGHLKNGDLFQMVHTSPSYWGEQIPGAEIVNAVPFGMTAKGTDAWLAKEGLGLWRKMYEQYGLYPFPMGHTGVQMGGWFKWEVQNIESFRGKKIRMSGLGSKVLENLSLGIQTESWLESNIVDKFKELKFDAVEWIGPYADDLLGLNRINEKTGLNDLGLTHYYYPGWHSPAGLEELVISKKKWDDLPLYLQIIIEDSAYYSPFAVQKVQKLNFRGGVRFGSTSF